MHDNLCWFARADWRDENDEITPIGIGAENFPAVNAANETVLQQAGNIETNLRGMERLQ